MEQKNWRIFLGVAAGAIVIYLVLLWQPARQVQLHQRHLLRAVEKRNWTAVSGFLSPDYRDRWEHDRETVVEHARQVFGQFLSCNLEGEVRTLQVGNGVGTITTRLTLGGSGSAISQFASQRVNSLQEPFTFTWRQQSWKPWDWILTTVDQPELEFDGSFF